MPKILYVTEEMQKRAASIGEKTSEIFDSQNQVTNVFRNLGSDFSGQIPSLMIEKMIAMESNYREINITLTAYKEFLEKAAQNMEWTDSQISRWDASLGRGGA